MTTMRPLLIHEIELTAGGRLSPNDPNPDRQPLPLLPPCEPGLQNRWPIPGISDCGRDV
jgi:hypothetical protein